MRVDAVVVDNVELFLESFVDKDDSNQAGETFFCESSNVSD